MTIIATVVIGESLSDEDVAQIRSLMAADAIITVATVGRPTSDLLQGLTSLGLLPEEWGGDTAVVPLDGAASRLVLEIQHLFA